MDQINTGPGGKLTDILMSGDFGAAWDALALNAKSVFTAEGFKDLMNTAVKYGIAKFVIDATPLKKSFSMFGIRIGF